MNKICLISDLLAPPYDEGMKVFARAFAHYLSRRGDAFVITNQMGDLDGVQAQQVRFGRTLVSADLRRAVRNGEPDMLIYLPEAALTSASLARAYLLRRSFHDLAIAAIGLQPRATKGWGLWAARHTARIRYVVQSRASMAVLANAGLNTQRISSGVDTDKFRPVNAERKRAIRSRLGLDLEAFIVLHVGHLADSRNLADLEALARDQGMKPLIVASTSTAQEQTWKRRLEAVGATVLDETLPAIEEVYQAADAYVFPVEDSQGAMEMPLSVLEALACGVPVLSTRFGALTDHFDDGAGVYFFSGRQEMQKQLERCKSSEHDIHTVAALAAPFTWQLVFDEFLEGLRA